MSDARSATAIETSSSLKSSVSANRVDIKAVDDEQVCSKSNNAQNESKERSSASRRILEVVKRAARAATSQRPRAIISEEEISRDIVYPLEWHKTISTFIALAFAMMLNHMALSTAHDVVSRNALPDLFFALSKQHDWALEVGDVLCSSSMIISLLFIAILHKHRFIILRRMAYNLSILYVMRAFCICVTHIPASYKNNAKKCIRPSHDSDTISLLQRSLKLTYQFGLQIANPQGLLMCGDQLFSGHTILVSTTTFYLNHYTPHSVWPLRWILILSCVLGMACLSLSRTHYTVDVMISYWLSSLLFSIYHAFVSTPHSARLRARAYRRLIIYWTMFVMEVNVPSGRLPNELEWPFSRPQSIKDFVQNWSDLNLTTRVGRFADFIDAHRLNTHL
uniref:Phosphatidylcholine:ceramide cholinephosphotransferase 3 n=1 Tax=Ascaris suum TaxID=6253 RepID=F1L6D8_ASCSU